MDSPRAARRRRGVVLMGVLIILLTIGLIGATLASFFISVTIIAELELTRAQALYLAEAGIAQAIYDLRQAGLAGGEAQRRIGPLPLGDGMFEAIHDLNTGLITATGTVHGVRRTVQVKYIPF